MSVLCRVSEVILSSVLPACPPATVPQHVLLQENDKGKCKSLPRVKRYFKNKRHWMDCSGRNRSEEGVWRAESASGAQIRRGDEALEGEIGALLGSAVLTAAIPVSHQSLLWVYLGS